MVMRTLAGRLAGFGPVPTALQAVLGYYADSGVFDRAALSLKGETDDRIERIVDDVFDPVEDALEREFGRESVDFSYDTKLLLPAQLTLGYVYREARRAAAADPTAADAAADGSAAGDPVTDEIADGLPEVNEATLADDVDPDPRTRVVRTERMTRMAVEALLDGDMRDAINDAEYEDFEVDFPVDDADRERVAEVAQSTLEESLREKLERLPDVVTERYEAAVDYSEAHQDRDEHFRDLMRAAEDGDRVDGGQEDRNREDGDRNAVARDAVDAIYEEYKHADYEDPPDVFDDVERQLPYSKTQYARVGVLYDAMLELYRMAGLDIDRRFSKAIVLSIVGAQIWLDDVDDYEDDHREGQLTPVTAEYLLEDDADDAYDNVVDITELYLDLAAEHATAADSALTGIAVEYIYRSGDPSVLPGGS